MAIKEIVLDDNDILFKPTKNIYGFNTKYPKQLCRHLEDTLKVNGGLGLSANQINEPFQMFVINWAYFNKKFKPRCFINPKIVEHSGENIDVEGCLSIPDKQFKIKRFNKVKIKFQNLKGKFQELEAEGLLAIVLQHEVDHLNGILISSKEEK